MALMLLGRARSRKALGAAGWVWALSNAPAPAPCPTLPARSPAGLGLHLDSVRRKSPEQLAEGPHIEVGPASSCWLGG